jgi:shikimate kinase
MNIILIGFMGSGKSTVGRLLAKELKMNFLDTDALIEKTEGRKIAQIFKKEGENYFRNLETEVLKTLGDYENFVLATGGGMVLREENVALLKSLGPRILLWAQPRVIYERIKMETHRPLLQVKNPVAQIQKILNYRRPFYERVADFSIDGSRLNADQVTGEIIKWLKSR